ncbi:MAG: hypothetical protein WBD21_11520 [Candidatus Acidiferrales bacterium]
MSTSAAAIANLASVEFESGLYDTVSITARLSAVVTSRASAMRLAWYLHRVNKSTKALLDLVDESLSGKRTVEKSEPVTPQKLQELADNLNYLIRGMEYQCEQMRRARLTNNSLVAGALKTYGSNLEPLTDLADWIDAVARPDELDSIFARAKEEKERNEVYEVNRVE